MKKKKLISLVLAGTMVFGLAACGSNGGDKKSEGNSDSDKVVKVAVVETAYGADMWNDVAAAFEKETGVKAVDTNQDCAENAKYIVLAIKPQFYDNVLADIKDHVTKENIIISIAPGITIDSVNEKLGGDRRIVRAMPNTPALIGEGMTGVCYDKKLFEETEKQMISNFFESFGMMEIVPEYMMNAVVCISSSAPAYI